MILIAYKYRVYPNNEQALMLTHTFGCVRFAYNSALGYSKEQYDLGNKTNYNDWSKNLTQLKKNPDFAWLKDVSSVPLQQALKHLDKGFKWEADKQSLTLAKMKQPLKIKWSRSFTGKPSSLTVSKTKSGKYFISILVKEDIKKLPVANKTVGVDVGIKDLAICSDGTKFNNPRLTNKYASKLAKAQRKLAKKKKGSNNFNKQKRVVARIHEKIANSRKDFTQKMTTKLINENQVIGIESLKVKNMVKNRKLSKHIHDANFGEIVRQLEYKADWYGRKVSAISQWFPSSKMCNECGSLYSGKWSLAIRTWSCECGAIHDRDHNAAINIHNEGLRLIA